MLRYGYLDNQQQADELVARDAVESSRAIVRKEWMDTKRKDATNDIAEATARISKVVAEFKPDLILLGDDNAANDIGNQFLEKNVKPSTLAPRTPRRGPLMVNRQRARALGLTISPDVHIDEYVDQSIALQEAPASAP